MSDPDLSKISNSNLPKFLTPTQHNMNEVLLSIIL